MIQVRPAIDLMAGKCVRLMQGRFDAVTEYSGDPVSVAKQFESIGCTHLHLVDLDGARLGQASHWGVLERIARETCLSIDFGGGLRSEAAIRRAIDCGAKQVSVGSVAVREPQLFEEWLRAFGSDTLILAADCENGRLRSDGWQNESSLEITGIIARFMESGLCNLMSTEISRDGLLSGPALALYDSIIRMFPGLFVIASGGVRDIDDVYALEKVQVSAVVIGRALYEGTMSLESVGRYRCLPSA